MLTTVGDWHHRAIEASQGGRHDEAASLFRLAAEAAPREPSILSNLGLALARGGRFNEAIDAYRSALQLAPGHAATLAKLGRVLSSSGQHTDAVQTLDEAVRRSGSDPDTINALGAALAQASRGDEARRAFQNAVRLDPGFAEAWANLGQLEADDSRWSEAERAFRQAAALEPSAKLFYKQGVALGRLGEMGAARDVYRLSLAHDDRSPETWNNLGHVLGALEDHEGALVALGSALRLRPDYSDARYNLGVTLQGLNRHQEARTAYQLVLAREGPHADALNNLAGVCLTEARPEMAAGLYERALAANPAHGEARWNLSLAQLACGDFANGWRNYESRPKARPYPAETAWDGEQSLAGRTVLLWSEQGLGDTVQFLRFAPEIKRRGAARIVVECPERLAGLVSLAEGVDAVTVRQAGMEPAIDFDWHASLMSLPLLTGVTSAGLLPPPGPAYSLDADRRAFWRDRLARLPAGLVRAGVVWGGNPVNRAGLSRSMPARVLLSAFAPVDSRMALIGLQHGPQCGELEALMASDARLPMVHCWEQTDLVDTAALVAELDLVITVDTLMAHLAGTVGRRVWTLLSFAADWRWMTGRLDSPWYPSMRLFRQPRPGDWAAVAAEAAEATRELLP